jgi:hypothetical protein
MASPRQAGGIHQNQAPFPGWTRIEQGTDRGRLGRPRDRLRGWLWVSLAMG